MNVELSENAAGQVDNLDAWWRAHRTDSPDLFLDELTEAITALSAWPGRGTAYVAIEGVRRYLLRKTRYHVYFRADRDRVLILAVWSAVRGQGPKL